MRVCATHRCWNHPDDKITETCPLAEWEQMGSGATAPCEWVPNTIPHAVCHGTGKVYPNELVDRIARVICARDANIPFENADREWYRMVAVAVLAALDGETP